MLFCISLLSQPLGVLDLSFKTLTARFKRLHNVLKLSAVRAYELFGAVYDVHIHPESLAYREGVTLAGHAYEQAVCRTESFYIKLTASVFYPLSTQGKLLQLCVVSCARDFRALLSELFENRDCQRRSLDGIGACSQLVNQGEGGGVRLFKYGNNICHMSREGRKALLNALFVADIYQHASEYRQLAVVGGGYHHSAHRHKREQSDRFERYRFTARVRTRDDERVKFLAEINVDRHDLASVDKRMTRLLQVDLTLVVEQGERSLHTVG